MSGAENNQDGASFNVDASIVTDLSPSLPLRQGFSSYHENNNPRIISKHNHHHSSFQKSYGDVEEHYE